MPYKKEYSAKTVGKGGSSTPASVMGGQGKSAKVQREHYMPKATGNTPFPKK